MYEIDENVFLLVTGTSYQSELGIRLRQIAVRTLRQISDGLVQDEESNTELAHKIKGIALSFGANEIARICLKLEQYDAVIRAHLGKEILSNISNALICLIDV